MSKISVVDDDAALDLLVENLHLRGYEASRYESVAAALESLGDILLSDLVILDVFMTVPQSLTAERASGIRTSGMSVYQSIRARNRDLPILVYSACNDKDTVDLVAADQNARFLGKWTTPSQADIAGIVGAMLGIEQEASQFTVFIVHGHNDSLKYELKNYLQNTLELPEPIILHEEPQMGRTLIQKFEDYAYAADIAFVLLTPDDRPAHPADPDTEKRRARQNVILELGFFLGVLGRETGRVILLHHGPLELPSDLFGLTYIDVSKGIGAVGESIRKELEHVRMQS